jgi:cation diffusion facilitator family transporter
VGCDNVQTGTENHHDHGHGHGEPGHSHAHAAVDQAMETSREGVRALKISLLALGLTAAVQLGVALVSDSVALLSDSLHNFADALTALPLWLAFNLGRRPPTRRFTYGYGRAEDIAGLVVVAIIAASGALAAWEAIDQIGRAHV